MPYVTFCDACDAENLCSCEPRNDSVRHDLRKSDSVKHSAQGFAKADTGKTRMALVPPSAMREVAEVLTFGARKYGAHNWRKCDDLSRYEDALLRHINDWQCGELIDSESGYHHLAHAICCAMFLMELENGK